MNHATHARSHFFALVGTCTVMVVEALLGQPHGFVTKEMLWLGQGWLAV